LINFGARLYDYELGKFISPDPTVQKPYDPQTYARYSYARNNPIKWVDVDGLGFWSWLKSFFRGFIAAVIGTILTILQVPAPIAFAIGGAVSGAIFGAIEGGLSGALRGAAWGGAMGFAFGTLNMIDPSGTLVGLAAIGGGVHAGITGGVEGLANYAAGALGCYAGYATVNAVHNSLISKPTVNTANPDTTTGSNNQQNSGIKTEVQNNLSDGDIVGTGDTRSSDLSPPAQELADRGGDIAQGGQNGTAGQGDNPDIRLPNLGEKGRAFYMEKTGGMFGEMLMGVKALVNEAITAATGGLNYLYEGASSVVHSYTGKGLMEHFKLYMQNPKNFEGGYPTKFQHEWNLHRWDKIYSK